MNKEPSVREMAALWNVCATFIEKYQIGCSESVYQNDFTFTEYPELVDDICKVIGYAEFEDDE